MLNDPELKKRFTYHAPQPIHIQKFEDIRKNALYFANLLKMHCPESRELSLAITKVEEAVMWANAAIARNEKEEQA